MIYFRTEQWQWTPDRGWVLVMEDNIGWEDDSLYLFRLLGSCREPITGAVALHGDNFIYSRVLVYHLNEGWEIACYDTSWGPSYYPPEVTR